MCFTFLSSLVCGDIQHPRRTRFIRRLLILRALLREASFRYRETQFGAVIERAFPDAGHRGGAITSLRLVRKWKTASPSASRCPRADLLQVSAFIECLFANGDRAAGHCDGLQVFGAIGPGPEVDPIFS